MMALETNLCCVLGFVDHQQSDTGVLFVKKATQQWAKS